MKHLRISLSSFLLCLSLFTIAQTPNSTATQVYVNLDGIRYIDTSSQQTANELLYDPLYNYEKPLLKTTPKGMIFFNPAKVSYALRFKTNTISLIPPARHYISSKIQPQHVASENYFNHRIISNNISDYYRPFYFKKWEVTVAEYRLFVHDVLSKSPNGMYTFYRPQLPELAKYQVREVMIFPDSNVFKKDTDLNSYRPRSKALDNYFTSDTFQDRPMVGINYFQALAFLDWLTHTHQQKLDKTHPDLEISYRLPSEIEWFWITSSEKRSKRFIRDHNNTGLYDNNYISNLYLTLNLSPTDSINQPISSLTKALQPSYHHINGHVANGVIDGSIYTLSHTWRKGEFTDINSFKVMFLSGNVSEWMRENYQDHWKAAYQLHQSKLASNPDKSSELLLQLETYYNQFNDRNGQLVRGGNFLCESHVLRNGADVGGIHAKKFIAPHSQHATVGFRYVAYVSKKQKPPVTASGQQ